MLVENNLLNIENFTINVEKKTAIIENYIINIALKI